MPTCTITPEPTLLRLNKKDIVPFDEDQISDVHTITNNGGNNVEVTFVHAGPILFIDTVESEPINTVTTIPANSTYPFKVKMSATELNQKVGPYPDTGGRGYFVWEAQIITTEIFPEVTQMEETITTTTTEEEVVVESPPLPLIWYEMAVSPQYADDPKRSFLNYSMGKAPQNYFNENGGNGGENGGENGGDDMSGNLGDDAYSRYGSGRQQRHGHYEDEIEMHRQVEASVYLRKHELHPQPVLLNGKLDTKHVTNIWPEGGFDVDYSYAADEGKVHVTEVRTNKPSAVNAHLDLFFENLQGYGLQVVYTVTPSDVDTYVNANGGRLYTEIYLDSPGDPGGTQRRPTRGTANDPNNLLGKSRADPRFGVVADRTDTVFSAKTKVREQEADIEYEA